MERINLFDELNETGYKVALFTSFSTDLVFFEKMILRHLIENNCTYIGLFLDQRCLYDAIVKPNITELGKSYIVKGMETNQAFHPKVYLLLGENRAKVLIGSGNLTPAGFITNHEVFNSFTYDRASGDTERLAEIQSAFNLFQSMHQVQDNKAWQDLFDKTKEFTYLWEEVERTSILLTNHVNSLEDQLINLLPNEIKEIECFVPFFDQSLSLINKWNERYQSAHVKIFLQSEHTNFPRHLKCKPNVSLYKAEFLSDSHKRYHGKVFRFIGKEEEAVIYGSGNCSRQAFLFSFNDGGNSEAIVIEKGRKGEFDRFWEEHISLTPLPNPLPDDFKTMEDSDQQEGEKEALKIQFIDGVKRENTLFVTIKTTLALDELLIENKGGVRMDVQGNHYTYAFKGIEQLSLILSLEGQVAESCIHFKGWYHDPIVLINTFLNTKSSVHHQLPDDPYLNDYNNLVALLDDLQNRLVLTENDAANSEQKQNRLHAIHNEAELGNQKEYISDNIDDYYVSEDNVHTYGALGNVDVVGNLIRILLKGFNEESAATLEITSDKNDRRTTENITTEIPRNMREQLQKRMKRFMNKFNSGISSDHYLENIEPDILIKNMTIYSGFLFLLKQRLGDQFVSESELVFESYEMMKALIRFSENHILDLSREDMKMLLIQSMATIAAKEYITAESEDNYNLVRSEKKVLGQLLKKIHKQIHPIGKDLGIYSSQVCHFLQRNFGIKIDAASFEKTFYKLFPLISFQRFENQIKNSGLIFKKAPLHDEPTITLEREFRNNPDFNLIQLKILADMLKVEEWEDASTFKIRWVNSNPELPLKGFVLLYNQEKKLLKKKYVYRNGEPLIEQKGKINKHQLQSAAEKGEFSIIGEGFRTLNKR